MSVHIRFATSTKFGYSKMPVFNVSFEYNTFEYIFEYDRVFPRSKRREHCFSRSVQLKVFSIGIFLLKLS